MTPEDYIAAIKAELSNSPAIATFEIVKETTIADRGYIRARCQLANRDFLEIAEFFIIRDGSPYTDSYRYQWMDSTRQQLRRRWDNVKHFPNLPNFPHHVHIETEDNVHPSEPRNSIEILSSIEQWLT